MKWLGGSAVSETTVYVCNIIFVQQQFGDVELPQAIKMPTRYNKGNHPKPYKLESCRPEKRLKLQEVGLTPASLHAMLRKGVATVCVLVGYESKPHPLATVFVFSYIYIRE